MYKDSITNEKVKKRHTYKDYTQKEKDDIKKLYESGISTVQIGKKYKVSHKVIARVLESLGIRRNCSSNRKYSLNENYFDCIDTPNKAYILGFFYADGSNCFSKKTISMALQEHDKDILERIRLEIKSEKKLEYIDYTTKHDFGYNYKNQYRLLLFSAHMCKTLNSIGMVPNKSLKLDFPHISPSLYSHFIRGYYDGDGSLYVYIKPNGTIQPHFTITSTDSFCRKTQIIFSEVLKIKGGNIYDASCHNGITKVLTISGRTQVKLILDWLYSDAELFLERKYHHYMETFYKESILTT